MTGKIGKILAGSGWMVAMSWYQRLLGAISLVILARLLTKDDFGIVAACFLIQAFFSVLSDVGSQSYLVRKPSISQTDLNAAFTLALISKGSVSVLIFAASPLLADVMHTPELEGALRIMALSPLFIALQNPAIHLHIKKLSYRPIFLVETLAKTVSTIVTLAIVYTWTSFWGIIIGEAVYRLLATVGSYAVCHQRPKFRMVNLSEQWHFSKWLLLRGWVGYLRNYFDQALVGNQYSISALGIYSFGKQNAGFVCDVLISPLNKVLYPAMADYLDDKDKLAKNYARYCTVLFAVYLPVMFGGIYLAEDIIVLVFGQKWLEAVPFFSLFLVISGFRLLNGTLTDMVTLLGKLKMFFVFELATTLLFIAVLLFSTHQPLYMFALIRLALTAVSVSALFILLGLFLPGSGTRVVLATIPLFITCVLMQLALGELSRWFEPDTLLLLAATIFIGAVIYLVLFISAVMLLRRILPEFDFIYSRLMHPALAYLKLRRANDSP